MMMKRIFVSSTYSDLRAHRRKITEVLRRLDTIDVAMEHFGARDARPKDECLRLIREESDLYIGIFAHRYGYIVAGDEISITESEYRAAQRQGLPCLIYILREGIRWPEAYIEHGDGAAKLTQLKSHLKSNHIVGFFSSATDLSAQVAADVGRELVHEASRRASLTQTYLHDTERELRLIGDLRSADSFKVRRAITALSHSESAWLIDSLKGLIFGKDEELAQKAIDALVLLPGVAALQAIGEGLLAESLGVRKWAAFSLGEAALCGRRTEAQAIVDVLAEALKNPAESVHVLDEVVHALGKVGGTSSFDSLVSVLHSGKAPSGLKVRALYSGIKFFDRELNDRFIRCASTCIESWPYDHLVATNTSVLFASFPDSLKQAIRYQLGATQLVAGSQAHAAGVTH